MIRRAGLTLFGVVLAIAGPARGDQFELAPRTIDQIKPGTVIGDKAPDGWTNLIVKNKPFVEADQAAKLVPIAVDLAQSFFAAIVANVARDESAPGAPFRLQAVASGVGTPIGDQDVVVTTDTQADLGANMGFIARTALARTEAEARLWTQVARGPNCAVLDAPAMIHLQGKHYQVVVRYFVVVDPRDGRLTTYTWVLQPLGDGQFKLPEQSLVRQEHDLVHRYPLMVDENEITVGVPNAKTFAMGKLAEGTKLEWPTAVRAGAALSRYDAATLVNLQNELARVVHVAGKKPKP